MNGGAISYPVDRFSSNLTCSKMVHKLPARYNLHPQEPGIGYTHLWKRVVVHFITPLCPSQNRQHLPRPFLLKLFQPLHHLLSQKLSQSQNPLPRDNPIRPTLLIATPRLPFLLDELAAPVHLQAPEYVLRVRDPPEIRRVPEVGDVDPSAASCAAGAALTCRGPGAGARRCACVGRSRGARALGGLRGRVVGWDEGGSCRGGEGRGLGFYVWVRGSVLGEDGVQDGEELGVLAEGGWRRGDGGCVADCEFGLWRRAGEEGEDVSAWERWVGKGVLVAM